MPHLHEQYDAWIGRVLTDASGHRIGRIEDLYTDDDTGQPEWLAVTTGLMGSATHFVPMRGATANGGGVQVPFPKEQVKVAPSAGADGRLSRLEKGRLYAHYGSSYAEERNRLQRSLGTGWHEPSRAEDGRDVRPLVDLRDASGPIDVRETSRPVDLREAMAPVGVCAVSRPVDGHDDPGCPPAGRGQDRGRWPDDEAIFGLIQDVANSPLAASGSARRR